MLNWLKKLGQRSDSDIINQALSMIPIYFSKDLISEIYYKLEIDLETMIENEEPISSSPFRLLYTAVNDIADFDSNNKKWMHMIRRWLIELGVYREITEQEMKNILISGGKKYDFKMNGKFYIFEKHPNGI